jgi:Chaperone of endosialidase
MMAMLCLLATTTTLNAQLTVRQLMNTAKIGGKINIGLERTTDDPNSITTMGVYGYGTPFGSGGKIHFGDFSGGGNYAYIGEWSDVDSDILEMHGASGLKFTVGSTMPLTSNSNTTNVAGEILSTGVLSWNGDILARGMVLSSDERLKSNKTNLPNTLASMKKIKALKYDMRIPFHEKAEEEALKSAKTATTPKEKAAADKRLIEAQQGKLVKDQYGFSAQEVQKIYPELVTEGADGFLAVRYTAFIPLMLQAMQEQQALIETLQAEVEKLKKK